MTERARKARPARYMPAMVAKIKRLRKMRPVKVPADAAQLQRWLHKPARRRTP